MKQKTVTAIIGAAMVMAALSGCGSSQKNSGEQPETLVIADMEIVEESETESETQSEAGTEALELDLSETDKEPEEALSEKGELVEDQTEEQPESAPSEPAGKPGEAEPDTEKTIEDQSQEKAEEVSKQAAGTEKTKQTGKKGKAAQTEVASQTGSNAQTEGLSQAGSNAQTEDLSQAGEAAQTEAANQAGEAAQTEAMSQAGEAAQTEELNQVGGNTQTEAEVHTEQETAAETDAPSQAAGESEQSAELLLVNDRVNVRKEPSTEAEIQALLTGGMKVLALEHEEEWTLVRYETAEELADGYVKSEYLSSLDALYTASEKVNVRESATTDSAKLGALAANDSVIVLEELASGWSKIQYSTDSGTVEAYVKSEFLQPVDPDSLNDRIVEEAKRLARETAVEEMTEGEAESELATEAMTEGEPGTEADSSAEGETEEVSEGAESSGTETMTEGEPGTEADSGAESETDLSTEAESESETEALSLSDGIAGQFELARLMLPEAKTVGLIYASENEAAAVQMQEYEKLAAEYGMELSFSEMPEAVDIDLIASELVGSVDCIFCMEDAAVDELLQTVCAYADEVEIPVIGLSASQVQMGSAGAYADGVLYWNTVEASKLGLEDLSAKFEKVQEY